jgi:uncharacterized repeat protein (TIGR01451 family)
MVLKRDISVVIALLLALALTWGLLLALDGDRSRIAHAQGPDGYDTYYVAPSGDCGGMTPCYATIQAAVDAADDPGDVIKIAAGTYTGINGYGGLVQVVYVSKTVTIRGGYTITNWTTPDPEANATTLDAQEQGRVLYITGDIRPTIEGLHITGGEAIGLDDGTWNSQSGGGMYVLTATATISNNWIFSNTAFSGGGLFLLWSDATLIGNTVSSNTGTHSGGGVSLGYSNATLVSNVISSNTTSYGGGGLLAADECDATIYGNIIAYNTAHSPFDPYFGNSGGVALVRNRAVLSGNLIAHNSANEGGGIGMFDGDYVLINNVIVNNQASTSGSGLFIDRAFSRLLHTTIAHNTSGDGSGVYISCIPDPSNVALTNTILVSHTVGIYVGGCSTVTLEATLWGNTTDWSGAGSITTGTVNLWGDPAFVNPGAGDFHIGPDSTARDAGVDADVNTDMDGDVRPYGSGYDLGADEFALHPKLALTKHAHPALVQAGEQLTYTLTLTNTGDVDLNATITDTLPDDVTSTGVLTWETGRIAPEGVWMQQVVVTVPEGYSGLLTNIVRATTSEGATGVHTAASQVQLPGHPLYLPLVLHNSY